MKYLSFRTALVGVVGAGAALIAVALAGGGDANTAATPVVAAPSNPASAGLVAAKDPVTGALRPPTAEEIAALRPAGPVKGVEPKLKSERLPNGAVVTTLDASYDLYSVAAQEADGKIKRACVPADKLEETLRAAQIRTLSKEEVSDEK